MTKPPAATRVLLIDDDAPTREGFTEYLANSGFEVYPVANGQQALTAAMTWNPDVVVLDLGLPDIDGWEVARQLKASPQTSAVPIVALTGAGHEHERASAMRAGCDRHLSKPCIPTELVAAIRRSLGETV